jgi:hypothetical protein
VGDAGEELAEGLGLFASLWRSLLEGGEEVGGEFAAGVGAEDAEHAAGARVEATGEVVDEGVVGSASHAREGSMRGDFTS